MKEEGEAQVGSWRPVKILAFTLGDTRPLQGCQLRDILLTITVKGVTLAAALRIVFRKQRYKPED